MSARKLVTLLFLLTVVSACFPLGWLGMSPDSGEVPISIVSSRYSDIPQGSTPEGFPQLGDPKSPVQVVVFSSFDCSHCATFSQDVLPGILERVQAGEVLFVYVPLYGTGSMVNGEGAARAAICAGEQGRFWEYHDLLFEWQTEFGQPAFSQQHLASGAEMLELVHSQWETCLGGSGTSNILDSAFELALSRADFTGTPYIVVDDVQVPPNSLDQINAAIDKALGK